MSLRPCGQPRPHRPKGTAASLSADELDASLSKLADLRDRGLITPEEFEEKKKELLDRL